MPVLWVDADVFIQAKNGPYKFRRVPEFWNFLSKQIEEGTIKCPKIVYEEITEGNDDLAAWFSQRRGNGLDTDPSEAVQAHYRAIAGHVYASRTAHQAGVFLKGGDGWVIAHALESGGMAVTQESERSKKSKVKVPAICKHFRVPCIDTYEMLELLDFDTSKG